MMVTKSGPCLLVEHFLCDGGSRLTKENLCVKKKITFKYSLLLFITNYNLKIQTLLLPFGYEIGRCVSLEVRMGARKGYGFLDDFSPRAHPCYPASIFR
jgi:hypothetical protein